MSRQDIEFKSSDGVTLRDWFYTSSTPRSASSAKLPCLIMIHGFSAVKEMSLDYFAEQFLSAIPSLSILIYDNRGFGASDAAPGQPRQEIIPALQCSDLQDAITYARTREEVDPERIGIWGSSYAGGHVLFVAAVDKRVKAVISQVRSHASSRPHSKIPAMVRNTNLLQPRSPSYPAGKPSNASSAPTSCPP
jgi:cephalosporin-C deacetylase-like acetyl esterase